MRLVFVVAVCAVLVVGCGSAESASAANLTTSEIAELSADAVVRACERYCDDSQVYVLARIVTKSGDEEVMPVETQQALLERVDRAEIITLERQEGMFANGLVIDPDAVVINVGPVVRLGDGLVGIDITVATHRDGYRTDTYEFRSTGDGWEPTSPEESGVTVTTSVS